MKNLDEKVKTKIIRIIQAITPDADIYLFGSRATGQHRERSDIDIALDAGEPIDPMDVGEVKDLLEASNIPYSFDVVDMHAVGQELKENILSERVVWLKRK